jgi:cytidine deaminase
MSEFLPPLRFPELVFAIAGPLGVDVGKVADSLGHALSAVDYRSSVIKLTDENRDYPTDVEPQGDDYYSIMRFKMRHASALCHSRNDPPFHARLAIAAIRQRREALREREEIQTTEVVPSTAYIIRQLKRPSEVDLLRSVYGDQFILISVYASLEERKSLIYDSLRRSLPPKTPDSEIHRKLMELIEIDEDEGVGASGQLLREVFQLGDAFIGSAARSDIDSKLARFINALFGSCSASPNKDEYGIYAARSAALRSCDLSRQVGAAVLSDDGEVITQGCNEVPRAFGGSYWDGELPDYRDVILGFDPNYRETREVLRDLFQLLSSAGYLSDDALEMGTPNEIVDQLLRKDKSSQDGDGPLSTASIRDITEFGRVVHAEMNAICDAARAGRSVKGSTLYCTTFPCHNCTKHILAAGIKRVVYIEPYPKSRAQTLYEHEIDFVGSNPEKVLFQPFLGISPPRYRTIFRKGRRKDHDGQAKRWISDEPRPMVDVIYPSYLDLELITLKELFRKPSGRGPTPSNKQPSRRVKALTQPPTPKGKRKKR